MPPRDRRDAPGGDRASTQAQRTPGGPGGRTMLIVVAVVIGVVVLTTALGLAVFATDPPLPQATPAPRLLGEAVPTGQATHVDVAGDLEIAAGQAPAGGPHFEQPSPAGIYAAPIEDGKAIHSLEHGMVWITYRPDLISPSDLEVLRGVAQRHAKDVILSPRPANSTVATITSWGRRQQLTPPLTADAVEAFVVANVDKAPEPGIR